MAMQKEMFDAMILSIDTTIDLCKEVCVASSEEFEELTYKEIARRVNVSRYLQSKVDKIVTAELYHVLSMGNLTMSQQSTFIKKIKELSIVRQYLKPIAMYQLNPIPNIPDETEYKCTGLNIKLKGKLSKLK